MRLVSPLSMRRVPGPGEDYEVEYRRDNGDRGPEGQSRCPIAKGHAMGARSVEAHGLESAIDGEHRPFRSAVDPGQPAGVEAVRRIRSQVPSCSTVAIEPSQSSSRAERASGRSGTPSAARNQARSWSSDRDSLSMRARRSNDPARSENHARLGKRRLQPDDRPETARRFAREVINDLIERGVAPAS